MPATLNKIFVLLALACSISARANNLIHVPELHADPISLDLNHCERTLSKSNIFESYLAILQWKVRRGYPQRGIPIHKSETIWRHVTNLKKAVVILANRRGLDANYMTFVALVHDLAESIGVDYTLADNVPKEIKQAEELAHIELICENIAKEDPILADKVLTAWLDYEYKRTPEAILVKQLDKLDAAVSASYYEREGYPGLEEFYETPYQHIIDPMLKDILDRFVQVRLLVDDPYTWYFANLK